MAAPKEAAIYFLQMTWIIHLFVKDTVNLNRIVPALLVENDMVAYLKAQKPGLYDIIFDFQKGR